MNLDKTSPTGGPDSPPFQREPNSPHRILVVDDDNGLRQLNAEVLMHAGYHVDVAEDGAVAWDALQLSSYDLVVTDNNMCRLSGVGLIKNLHAARMPLPVIMATGSVPSEEFARYPWLQPAATLLKPYAFEALVETVKQILGSTNKPPRPTRTRVAHARAADFQ